MARPIKDGVDYFPFDVNTDGDTKFQIIEAKHGIVGFGIVVKIFQMIYRNGYYCEWTDIMPVISASKWSSHRHSVTERDVREVVRDAAKYGLFSEDLLKKYGILTSSGIQKRYFEVVKRRTNVNVKNEYLLLSAPKNKINVDKNEVNVDKNPIYVYKNPQSKVKRKKSKVKERVCVNTPPTLEEIKDFCAKENLKINPEKFYYYYAAKEWQDIEDWKAKACEWNVTEKQPEEENNFAAYDLEKFERKLNQD